MEFQPFRRFGECACGLYWMGELLGLEDNPYRDQMGENK